MDALKHGVHQRKISAQIISSVTNHPFLQGWLWFGEYFLWKTGTRQTSIIGKLYLFSTEHELALCRRNGEFFFICLSFLNLWRSVVIQRPPQRALTSSSMGEYILYMQVVLRFFHTMLFLCLSIYMTGLQNGASMLLNPLIVPPLSPPCIFSKLNMMFLKPGLIWIWVAVATVV